MAETIETTWGKVGQILGKKGRRSASRRVKVIIEHTPDEDVVKIQDQAPDAAMSDDKQKEFLRKFDAWVNSHEALPHQVDDSRASIYEEVIRDTR